MTPDDDLTRWISNLRTRLEEGILATLGPIELGDGTGQLAGETTIRIMLADLADLDDPAGSASGDLPWREERRHHLLGDFRQLRTLLS